MEDRCWMMENAVLEQFSELRDARNGTPHHSILSCGAVPVCFAALQVRPAQCFALALCELSQSARQKDVIRIPLNSCTVGKAPPVHPYRGIRIFSYSHPLCCAALQVGLNLKLPDSIGIRISNGADSFRRL